MKPQEAKMCEFGERARVPIMKTSFEYRPQGGRHFAEAVWCRRGATGRTVGRTDLVPGCMNFLICTSLTMPGLYDMISSCQKMTQNSEKIRISPVNIVVEIADHSQPAQLRVQLGLRQGRANPPVVILDQKRQNLAHPRRGAALRHPRTHIRARSELREGRKRR